MGVSDLMTGNEVIRQGRETAKGHYVEIFMKHWERYVRDMVQNHGHTMDDAIFEDLGDDGWQIADPHQGDKDAYDRAMQGI